MNTSTYLDVENLHDVLNGNAVYSNRTVTFGTRAGGGNVSMLLTDGSRARNALIVGATGSGKTGLLESLYEGTSRAGVDVALAAANSGDPGRVIADVQLLVEARHEQRTERWPLCLLLVDDLTSLSVLSAALLTMIAQHGPKVNVAVIAASQDATAGMPGGVLLRNSLTLGGLITLRTPFGEIPSQFADGSTTAGVGLVDGELFRAWWPGA